MEEFCCFMLGYDKIKEGDNRRQIIKYFIACSQLFPPDYAISTSLH